MIRASLIKCGVISGTGPNVSTRITSSGALDKQSQLRRSGALIDRIALPPVSGAPFFTA
jgi:hypothetical protein